MGAGAAASAAVLCQSETRPTSRRHVKPADDTVRKQHRTQPRNVKVILEAQEGAPAWCVISEQGVVLKVPAARSRTDVNKKVVGFHDPHVAITDAPASAAARPCTPEQTRVTKHLMPSCSSRSVARMPSHVAGVFINTRSRGTPVYAHESPAKGVGERARESDMQGRTGNGTGRKAGGEGEGEGEGWGTRYFLYCAIFVLKQTNRKGFR